MGHTLRSDNHDHSRQHSLRPTGHSQHIRIQHRNPSRPNLRPHPRNLPPTQQPVLYGIPRRDQTLPPSDRTLHSLGLLRNAHKTLRERKAWKRRRASSMDREKHHGRVEGEEGLSDNLTKEGILRRHTGSAARRPRLARRERVRNSNQRHRARPVNHTARRSAGDTSRETLQTARQDRRVRTRRETPPPPTSPTLEEYDRESD